MLRYLSTGLRPFGDHPMPPHKRFNWEFYAVIGGHLAPSLRDNDSYELKSDMLWLFSPGCEHGWTGERGKCCEVVVFHYSAVPAELQRLAETQGFLAVPLSPEDKHTLRQLAATLTPHVQQASCVSGFHAERALLDLSLLVLERALVNHPAPCKAPADGSSGPTGSPSIEHRVQAAERWFHTHLAQHPSAQDVAKAIGVSMSHLRRLFRKVRRQSPREAFNRLRLEHAMRLLAQSDLKLSGVACECGFTTPSHFCEAFKRVFGTTPTAWRRFAYIQYRHPSTPLPTVQPAPRNARPRHPEKNTGTARERGQLTTFRPVPSAPGSPRDPVRLGRRS